MMFSSCEKKMGIGEVADEEKIIQQSPFNLVYWPLGGSERLLNVSVLSADRYTS